MSKEKKCPNCGSEDITRVQREMTYKGKPGVYVTQSCDSCGHTLEIKELVK